MVLGLPSAHIVPGFADDRRRGHDIEAIDPGQVGSGHAKQLPPQVELRLIPVLFLKSIFPRFFRKRCTVASIISL